MPNSNQKEYWLGFMLGDGWITHMESQQTQIGLILKDKEHVQKFADFFGCNVYPKVVNDKTYWRSQKYDDELSEWFIKHGVVPGKSLIAKAHPSLQNSRHFWRGLIDADGHLGFTNRTPLITVVGTRSVLESLKKYLEPKSRAKIRPKGRVCEYRINANEVCDLIIPLYEGAEVSLERKHSVVEQFKQYLRDIYGN